jgi:hypothetical protein
MSQFVAITAYVTLLKHEVSMRNIEDMLLYYTVGGQCLTPSVIQKISAIDFSQMFM